MPPDDACILFRYAKNLLYTFLMRICFLMAWRLIEDEPAGSARTRRLLAAGLFALCRTRPEGVLFGALLYRRCSYAFPALAWPRFMRDKILLLILPGAAYCAWRFVYFGYPLPNTCYVKVSDGAVNPESVVRIARFIFHFCLPLPAVIFIRPLALDTRRAGEPCGAGQQPPDDP